MIYYVLSRSWANLAVAALLLIVLACIVARSLRQVPRPASPITFGLYGVRLALGVAAGLAFLMALSLVVGAGGPVVDLLFVTVGLLSAWFFVIIWASVAVCTFVIFFATARFAAPCDKIQRHAEQRNAADSR
jgi:hypothetical protein